MTKPYWFIRKRHGYGWTPDTWQGWLATAVYVVLISGFSLTLENSSLNEFISTLIFLACITIGFIPKRVKYPVSSAAC